MGFLWGVPYFCFAGLLLCRVFFDGLASLLCRAFALPGFGNIKAFLDRRKRKKRSNFK